MSVLVMEALGHIQIVEDMVRRCVMHAEFIVKANEVCGIAQDQNKTYIEMNGFEIKVNNEEGICVSGKVTTVIFAVNNHDHHASLSISGISHNLYYTKQISRNLYLGDKIKISSADICSISPIIEMGQAIDRKCLLEEYFKLKQELKQKGLI